MARSPDFSTTNQYIKYYINLIVNSQNVATNKSNVTIEVYGYRTNTGYSTYGTGTCYTKINGTTYTAAITTSQHFVNSPPILIFSKTLDIAHNTDGSKTLAMGSWIDHSMFSSSEQDWSYALPTIPRASTVTISNTSPQLGSGVTITITRASSDFYHQLGWAFGSINRVIANDVATSYQTTIPMDFAYEFPNADNLWGRVLCDTYYQGQLIGSSEVRFTAYLPTSYVPSITQLAVTGNSLFSGHYVKGKSTASVAITAAGVLGSTIKSYSTAANGGTYTAASFTTDPMKTAGANTIDVTVTDSRGRKATASVSITVEDYYNPWIKSLNMHRADSGGVAKDDGTYISVELTAEVASIAGTNAGTYTIEYDNGGTWVILQTLNGQSITGDYLETKAGGFSPDYSYTLRVTAKDSYGTPIAEVQVLVGTAFVLIDFSADGKHLAMGKVSEGRGILDLKGDLYIDNGKQYFNDSQKNPVGNIGFSATAFQVVSSNNLDIELTSAKAVKVTAATDVNVIANATTGNINLQSKTVKVGNDATGYLAFYGYTPVIQQDAQLLADTASLSNVIVKINGILAKLEKYGLFRTYV